MIKRFKRNKIILLISLMISTGVFAESKIKEIKTYEISNTLFLDLESTIQLPDKVIEALKNGLVLQLNYQFKIKKDQWYNPFTIVKREKKYSLSYNTLSKEYILRTPIIEQTKYDKNIETILSKIENIEGFPLINKKLYKNKKLFLLVKINLKQDKLPLFLRAEMFFSSQWNIDSNWVKWKIN